MPQQQDATHCTSPSSGDIDAGRVAPGGKSSSSNSGGPRGMDNAFGALPASNVLGTILGAAVDRFDEDDQVPFSPSDVRAVKAAKIGGLQYRGTNSAVLTAGIIVADVVGAGILGMPRAVRSFGWLLGGVVMVIMLAANVHISLLMWRVKMLCPEAHDAHSYVQLCRRAFQRAPKQQRRLVLWLTGVSQYSFLFGLMGLYLLSAGKGMGMLFYEANVCLPVWAAIACAMMLPFAGTAREMGSYKSLVWINILTLSGTVLIPLFYYIAVGVDNIRPEASQVHAIAPMTLWGVMSGLSTFTFGMTSQMVLVEIMSEMKDPAEFSRAYVTFSAPFQLAAFMIAGLGGYYFLGDKVSGMINENLPFNLAFQFAACCLVVHMLISYLIKGVVLCRAILQKAKQSYSNPQDPRKRTLVAWNAIVITILAGAWLLANLVPFFGDAVDLLGASFTPLSCWVIPILMFARFYWDAAPEERPTVTCLEWFCMACELALAVVLMVLGTYESLLSITENWHTYGYPFECHCEGLWATCACSAEHIGMDLCRVVPGV